MRNIARLLLTILLVVAVVTVGIFISRTIIYVIENKTLFIPFIDIFKVSIKAGLAGGVVGGIGIYFIPYCSTKMPRR